MLIHSIILLIVGTSVQRKFQYDVTFVITFMGDRRRHSSCVL